MHVYMHEATAQRASEGQNRPFYDLIFSSVLVPLITFMHFTYLLTITIAPELKLLFSFKKQ